MTSVDSGIETSNNSDDSAIAQNEDMLTDEINTSLAVATISGSQNDIRDTKSENLRIEIGSDWLNCSSSVRLSLPSLVSINENYKYPEEIEHSTPTSSSGPIILSSSVSDVASSRVYKFVTPPPSYVASSQKSIDRRKIKSVHISPRYNPVVCSKANIPFCKRRLRSEANDTITMRQLLNSGISLNNHDEQGRIPLHLASCSKSKVLFTECSMRVAATTNNIIMMRELLNSGVSPNNHDEQGRTPLHLASCRGYTEMVRLLLEHGADPNRRDCVGNIPLHLAAVTGKVSVVKLLLNAGTDLLSLEQESYNPLQSARTKLRLLQNCQGKLLRDLLANLDALSITQ